MRRGRGERDVVDPTQFPLVHVKLHEVNRIVLRDGVQPGRQGFRSLRSHAGGSGGGGGGGLVHDLARRPLASHVGRLHLVRSLPNLAQTDGAVEPVEDGQRHGDVRDDGPRPEAVEVQLHGVRLCPGLLQRVDRPHRQIRHQQERHDLPAWLPPDLLRRGDRPPRRVQDEDRLERGLHDARQRGDQHQDRVLGQGELGADDRERRVDEHAGLRGHQQDVVQL